MVFTKKVIQNGTSLYITIPVDEVGALDIKPHDYVVVDIVRVIKK